MLRGELEIEDDILLLEVDPLVPGLLFDLIFLLLLLIDIDVLVIARESDDLPEFRVSPLNSKES